MRDASLRREQYRELGVESSNLNSCDVVEDSTYAGNETQWSVVVMAHERFLRQHLARKEEGAADDGF